MAEKSSFNYTLELVNSIPDDIKNRSHLWRGIREQYNTLLEDGNRDKVLRVVIDSTLTEEEASHACESLRGSVYGWSYAVGLKKRGYHARTISDKRKIPYSVYISLVPITNT